MTPSDAQLAEIETLIGAERGPFLPGSIYRHMTDLIAALRDARAENERQRATVAYYQGVLIKTCAAKAEVQRREAEMRARIAALHYAEPDVVAESFHDKPMFRCAHSRNEWPCRTIAALSPAEETP